METKNTLQFEECEVTEHLTLATGLAIYAGGFIVVTHAAAIIIAVT